nr:immunoglobulin light chain junction region [Macaca mulatta]
DYDCSSYAGTNTFIF